METIVWNVRTNQEMGRLQTAAGKTALDVHQAINRGDVTFKQLPDQAVKVRPEAKPEAPAAVVSEAKPEAKHANKKQR